MNFVPFAGGKLNNKQIKSFWVTNSCVSNYQFLQFIENKGYFNIKYITNKFIIF